MNRSRTFTQAELGLAVLVIIGIFVQIYLIGAFAFGAGTDALDAHKVIGQLTHLLEVLVFVAALVAAWPAWRSTLWPFALAVVGSTQAFLAASADSGSAWVHGFHGGFAPVVLLIAIVVAQRARARLALGSPPPAPRPAD